jgi:uncharacterized Zn-finger protein
MDQSEVNLYCCMAPDCEKTYTSKFNLKRHVEIAHYGIKRFECSVCRGLYSSMQNLKEHVNLHYGLKPFTCVHCGETFRQASQLSLHKRSHARGSNTHVNKQREAEGGEKRG